MDTPGANPQPINILGSSTFKRIMYFKFFMVIAVWGLIPLLIPKQFIPVLGLHLTDTQVLIMRIWGIIVLLDFFVYLYIYKKPHAQLTKYLLQFGVIDNAGIGLILFAATPMLHLPWSIWINIPILLFFGYWFWKFYRDWFTKHQ